MNEDQVLNQFNNISQALIKLKAKEIGLPFSVLNVALEALAKIEFSINVDSCKTQTEVFIIKSCIQNEINSTIKLLLENDKLSGSPIVKDLLSEADQIVSCELVSSITGQATPRNIDYVVIWSTNKIIDQARRKFNQPTFVDILWAYCSELIERIKTKILILEGNYKQEEIKNILSTL